jgi:hypothetical protein
MIEDLRFWGLQHLFPYFYLNTGMVDRIIDFFYDTITPLINRI